MRAGKLYAAIGSSRSGKSQFVAKKTANQPRLLVWDIKGDPHDYHHVQRAYGKRELVRRVELAAGKPGRIAYTAPSLKDFDFFCRVAQVWVRAHHAAGHRCALVFEETADVTSPGKAPDNYGVILRRYLSLGCDIFAITQRPAESDKTAIGNASVVHVCRLARAADRRAVANDTGLALADIDALRADQDAGRFDFIEADLGRGVWQRGQLTFVRGKPKLTATGPTTPL